ALAELRNDVLITDHRGHSVPGHLECGDVVAARQVGGFWENLLEPRDRLVERDVLAEQHQVVLVEAARDAAVGLEPERAVVGAGGGGGGGGGGEGAGAAPRGRAAARNRRAAVPADTRTGTRSPATR